MAKPKALLSDFLYVPYHEVDLRALKKHMSVRHYDEKACRRCEHKPDRHSDTCEDCPAYAGLFKFWRKQEIGGKPFIGMAIGRDDLIEKIVGPLDRFKMYDKRSDVPFRTGLKFHGKLRDYQKEAVKVLLENEHGLLKSAPRTGKTVMGAAIACKVRQRTLIITHQDDLLKQFKHTFYDEELGMTNAQAILDKTGKEPVIIASNPDDFKNRDADVVLSTYQKFISPRGKKLLKRIRKYFGLVIIDEIHKGNAHAYSIVLSRLKPQRTYGLTATPNRKDGKEFCVDRLVGPVLHSTTAKAMTPTVHVHVSAMKAQVKAQQWVAHIRALCRNTPRNMDIVKHIIKDLKKGHSIVVPVTFRWYADALVEEVNNAWMDETNSTEIIAEPFYRMPHGKKEEVLERARSGKTRVIAAYRPMLLGVNVPRWSMLYEVIPINNPPNFEQETQRVCTPFEGKQPAIRFFVDLPSKPSIRCFLASLSVCKKLGYNIDPKSQEVIKRITVDNSHLQSYRQENDGLPVTIGIPGRKLSI